MWLTLVSEARFSSDTPISKRSAKSGFSRQRRDQRDEIGVAAALAKPVQRALDVPRAGENGGQRIGDRVVGVVMGVDAEMRARHMLSPTSATMRPISCGSVPPLVSHSTTQRAPAAWAVLATMQGVVLVGLVAVEEMLAIDDCLAALKERCLDRLADVVQIFLERAAERDTDMVVPGLGDEGDDIGVRGEKARHARIIGGGAACPFGHAEGCETGALQLRPLREKFGIERIGAGIAALDIIDPETIEQRGDMALVGERKIDIRRLRAVAQGRVEEAELFAGHDVPLCAGFGVSVFVMRVLPSHRPSISIVLRCTA